MTLTEYSKENNKMELLDYAIKILGIILTPVVGICAFVGKRLHKRLDEVEANNKNRDIKIAILETQYKDIKEDIQKIDVKLDKILELLPKK